MDEKLERDLMLGKHGAAASAALELMGASLSGRERAVKDRIFKAIDEGTLTGDSALTACSQLREIDGIIRSLHAKERKGKRAGENTRRTLYPDNVGESPAA